MRAWTNIVFTMNYLRRIFSCCTIFKWFELQAVLLTFLLLFSYSSKASEVCASFLSDNPYLHKSTNDYDEIVNPELVLPESWAADFVYLAVSGHLMSQLDSALEEMGLVDPDGGICGPTCVGNIAASLDFHLSKRTRMHWVENIHIFIDGLINKYQQIAMAHNDETAMDPLKGTRTHYFSSEFNNRNTDLGLFANHYDGYNILLLDYYLGKKDNISMGAVTFMIPIEGEAESSHAIVILGLNLRTKKIIYVDPNLPGYVQIADFIKVDGKLYFSLDPELFGDHEESYVRLDEIVTFTKIR